MQNNKGKKVSIKEIAKICDVSVATVSRVINNNGRFSEATRIKVEKAIKKYGYTTNMAAKSLRSSHSKTIGVIVPNIDNEFFSAVVLKLEKIFFDNGYSVFICNTSQNDQKEIDYFKSLDSKLVDGIICITGRNEIPSDVIQRDIPIVCIDRKPSMDSDAYYIESDNYLGGFIATEELIKKGCKNIVILSRLKTLSPNIQRLEGYKDALKKHNIEFNQNYVVQLNNSQSNFDGANESIQRLIENNFKFDGIFATNDWRAYGALVALQKYNISVPEKVKIVGFDGIPVSEYCYPPITTISQNKDMIAKEASTILLDLINKTNIPEKRHTVIPVELIVRETT